MESSALPLGRPRLADSVMRGFISCCSDLVDLSSVVLLLLLVCDSGVMLVVLLLGDLRRCGDGVKDIVCWVCRRRVRHGG